MSLKHCSIAAKSMLRNKDLFFQLDSLSRYSEEKDGKFTGPQRSLVLKDERSALVTGVEVGRLEGAVGLGVLEAEAAKVLGLAEIAGSELNIISAK